MTTKPVFDEIFGTISRRALVPSSASLDALVSQAPGYRIAPGDRRGARGSRPHYQGGRGGDLRSQLDVLRCAFSTDPSLLEDRVSLGDEHEVREHGTIGSAKRPPSATLSARCSTPASASGCCCWGNAPDESTARSSPPTSRRCSTFSPNCSVNSSTASKPVRSSTMSPVCRTAGRR